jgi:hypothetical protein
MANLFSRLFHWHQRLGLWVALAIIAWALSGLAHPIITRLQPSALPAPPAQPISSGPLASKDQLAQHLPGGSVNAWRLFQWGAQPVHRIQQGDAIFYLQADTGTLIEQGEQAYAEYLARQAMGDSASPVASVSTKTTYDEDYLSINRYLPVVRVQLHRPDALRAYVDTQQGRLATLVDERKALTGSLFRWVHTWSFISWQPLRELLMSLFLLLGALVSGMGFWLYIKSRRLGTFHRQHATGRKLHRSLGGILALPALAFCLSGLAHLWLSSPESPSPRQQKIQAAWANLNLAPLAELPSNTLEVQLIEVAGVPHWQYKSLLPPKEPAPGEAQGHHHSQAPAAPQYAYSYRNAITAEAWVDANDALTRAQVAALSDLPTSAISRITRLTRFTDDYGFINKRLPVAQVDFDLPGAPRLFIETATGTLAAQTHQSHRLEGYSFAYAHKWHFLDPLGKTTRDSLSALAALGIALLVGLGAYRRLRQRPR